LVWKRGVELLSSGPYSSRVDESDRDRILDAREDWRLAERSYSNELGRYLSSGWPARGPLPPPHRALDGEGYRDLMRLRRAADDAWLAFEEAVRAANRN
jgi:hypothetical protein